MLGSLSILLSTALAPAGGTRVLISSEEPPNRDPACPRHVERLESRVLLSASSLQVTIGEGAARTIRFPGALAATDTATLAGPGTASVEFTGSDLSAARTSSGVTVVTGTAVSLASITCTGTGPPTVLAFAAGRIPIPGFDGNPNPEPFSIGAINVNGSLRSVRLGIEIVSGDITVSGSVGTLEGGEIDGNVSIGGTIRNLDPFSLARLLPFAGRTDERR